jgi:hypothetical protein
MHRVSAGRREAFRKIEIVKESETLGSRTASGGREGGSGAYLFPNPVSLPVDGLYEGRIRREEFLAKIGHVCVQDARI